MTARVPTRTDSAIDTNDGPPLDEGPATMIAVMETLHIARPALLRALVEPRLVDRFVATVRRHYLATVGGRDKERERIESASAKSYVHACMTAAAAGLQPDGRDGWIVVRDGIASWAISWRGMVKLLRRAVAAEGGTVRAFCAELVYREEIERGGFTEDRFSRAVSHRPWYLLGIEVEPLYDSVVLAYAAATIVERDGTEHREYRVLTRAELNQRARMSGNPNKPDPSDAWMRWPGPQSKKSAVRALCDWMPVPDDFWSSLDAHAGAIETTAAPTAAAAITAAVQRQQLAAAEADAPRVTSSERDAGPHASDPEHERTRAVPAGGREAVEALRRAQSPIGVATAGEV